MSWLLRLIEERWESGIGLALLMSALKRKQKEKEAAIVSPPAV
jgi:hypothetical protein